MSASYSSRSGSSSTEALLPPQKPQKDYFAAVASMQGGMGIHGGSPLVPNPSARPSKPSEKSFWSRKDKTQPLPAKAQPQSEHPQPNPKQQPQKPSGQMSRDEALALLMDKYGMASIQSGGRSGRM
ncbi:hypothetical protein DACRYDRAFT_117813 [Dacryopinax primogenitus]|uniref:Uncharacterized protein n=1 Tax=Dacryopinax primogenitus (strain DJM 731) TaxID=1858805 RepID=M5G1B1_DACPD|nr:uncharacterized protein DACRYDRAFT_117813 [Dacryopinax primogenitus]EJT99611.1 hypothetical protein DACRYDRAFT_117813 [Dacryopinax primogenitus]